MIAMDRETIRRMSDEEFQRYLDELKKDRPIWREQRRRAIEQSIEAEKRWHAARAEIRARFGY
jgi:hypothetical protein